MDKVSVGPLIRPKGLEKSTKLINIGLTFITDYRVVKKIDCNKNLVFSGRLHQLLPILIEKTKISNKNNELWAEGRRDVIKAIMNIIKTVGVAAEGQGQGRSIILRFDILTHQELGFRITNLFFEYNYIGKSILKCM